MIRLSSHAAWALLVVGAVGVLLAAVSTAQAANNVTTMPVPGGLQPLAAKYDASRSLHLLCNSPDGAQYLKSTDDGQTFSQPIAVVDRAAQKPGLVFTAWDLAVGPKGTVHVVLSTNAWKLKLPKDEWALFYARLEPGAAAFAPVRNLNHQPCEGYSLAADDRGNVTACWLSGKLYAMVSHDDGLTFSPAREIDPAFDPCDCCTTSAAYGADGKLAILYREETNNERDMYLVLWDQGQNKVSRTRVSTTLWKIDACPMSYYSVVPAEGGFLAVWPTEGRVYYARLDAQGALQPPGEIKTPGSTGMRTGMITLTGKSGDTLVGWKKEGQLGWQLFDSKGQPSGRAESVKSPGTGVAGVVTPAGRFLLFR